MGISEENIEEFDAIHQKFKGFIQKEFKEFDYYIVYSISKFKKDKINFDNLVGAESSITGLTPWAVVKAHLGLVLSNVQIFLNQYNLLPPGEPIASQKPHDKSDKK